MFPFHCDMFFDMFGSVGVNHLRDLQKFTFFYFFTLKSKSSSFYFLKHF